MLQKDNVRLRPVKRSDVRRLLKWVNDPEVTQFITQNFPVLEANEEKWIEGLANNQKSNAVFIIETKKSKSWQAIGICGLHGVDPINHNAEAGTFIGEKTSWSKGIGTKAIGLLITYGFNTLNLHRINSMAVAFNQRSIGLQLKLGFKKEGQRKEAIFKNGTWHDLVMFGLLRKDWLKNNRK